MARALHSQLEKHIFEVVKAKRIEKGWSQKELAFNIEMSVGFIGDVESPKSRAKYNIKHINELAKAFKCSPKDFFPEKPL